MARPSTPGCQVQRRRHRSERDRRYLAALVQWGYQASDVEQLVLTPPSQATPEATAEATVEATVEAGVEAAVEAGQVAGTDTPDADPTTVERDPEDVAGAGADPMDGAGDTSDSSETGESAFEDKGYDEVQSGSREANGTQRRGHDGGHSLAPSHRY